MGGYLVRRFVSALVALFGVSTLAFFITALVPGNPAEVILGPEATPARLAAVSHEFGLDKPIWIRYSLWLQHTLRGDLGISTLSQQSVTSLLGDALPVTLELSLFSLLLAVAFALPVGLWLGANSRSWWARPIMFTITVGVSVPGFWVGLMLILVFAVKLGILPPGGFVSLRDDPLQNLRYMLLPSVTLALYLAPPLVRFLRSTVVSVLRDDYIKTARAKGISYSSVLFRHVAPNSLIPALTYLGLQLGVLISGAIITEVIFALPGMGSLGLNAILNRDYPVVQGVVLVVASGYVLANMIVDLTYTLIDPRVRVA
jgi:peptide/nickel transport system permease protein